LPNHETKLPVYLPSEAVMNHELNYEPRAVLISATSRKSSGYRFRGPVAGYLLLKAYHKKILVIISLLL